MNGVSGLRARLRREEPLLTAFVIVPRVEMVEIAAEAGFDAVVLDQEHGPGATDQLIPLLAAARAAGIHAIVRVPENRAIAIGSVLDAGADGVLVPHVSSPAGARAAVAAARFAPEGSRGVNPAVRAGRYGADTPSYLAGANGGAAVLGMIEGLEAVEAAKEIVATEGLDGVFLGPFDLSAALGIPGQTASEEVVGRIRTVVGHATDAGIASAVFAPTAEAARSWIELGVRLVALGIDTRLALDGFRAAVSAVRPAG